MQPHNAGNHKSSIGNNDIETWMKEKARKKNISHWIVILPLAYGEYSSNHLN